MTEIKVFYGLQRELKNDSDYHKYTLLDAGLSDDAVFATVTAFSIKGPQPAHVKLIWDKNKIKKDSEIEKLLAQTRLDEKKRLLNGWKKRIKEREQSNTNYVTGFFPAKDIGANQFRSFIKMEMVRSPCLGKL